MEFTLSGVLALQAVVTGLSLLIGLQGMKVIKLPVPVVCILWAITGGLFTFLLLAIGTLSP